MRCYNRIVIYIMLILLNIVAIINTVSAGTVISGVLGNYVSNTNYSIDENGTMTISGGNGSVYHMDRAMEIHGYDKNNIKKIVMNDGIYQIRKRVFLGLNSLNEVVFPSTLESIGVLAFSNCLSLESIKIPEVINRQDNILIISGYSFSDCSNLKNVELPEKPVNISISKNAFLNTAMFDDLDNRFENVFYLGDNAAYYIPEGYIMDNCYNPDTITIREGTITVMWGALSANQSVVRIILPEGLKNISKYSFSNCEKLRQIYIPESVDYIGEEAFNGSENVTIYCSEGSYAHEYAVNNDILYSFNIEEINLELWKKGDVNKDLSVSLRDALLILKHAAKIDELDEKNIQLADYNNDNSIDTNDSLMILEEIVFRNNNLFLN